MARRNCGMTTVELTKYVAEWVDDLQLDDVAREVRDIAIDHILDGYGVALSGVVEESHRILSEELASQGGRREAQVLGTSFRLPAPDAALLNGLAMHAM